MFQIVNIIYDPTLRLIQPYTTTAIPPSRTESKVEVLGAPGTELGPIELFDPEIEALFGLKIQVCACIYRYISEVGERLEQF